jgi:DNA primase|tara:strand:- start:7880 stop:8830 length:951 start_codon:yes stop_codon:yes gene_type:complete
MLTKLDWRGALVKAGIDVPDNKEEFAIPCPFHDTSHAGLSINTEKGVWICHAGCGEGRIVDFLEALLDITSNEALEMAMAEFDEDEELLDEDFFGNDPESTVIPNREVVFPFMPALEYPTWILNRGFTEQQLKAWECTVNNSTGSFIIPIKDHEAKLVGWVSRKAPDKAGSKYVYSLGMRTSQVIFGLSRVLKGVDKLYVTEGALDAIWLDQHGYSAVALLGIHMSNVQQALLLSKRPGEIVLCLDKDEDRIVKKTDGTITIKNPGLDARDKIQTRLGKITMAGMITIPDGYKDVQDIRDPKLLEQVLSASSEFLI